MKSSLKSHHHCVFNIHYHLVLVTKYRRKCLSHNILERLRELCEHQCSLWDLDLIEFGGDEDHVHLLLASHPNVMPSRFVNSLKTVTSRLLRKEYPSHFAKYYWKPTLWTRAYCLISAGRAPLEVIRRYIENQ